MSKELTRTAVNPVQQLLQTLSEEDTSGDLLICRQCSAAITHARETIHIGASHIFRFTNPLGIIYTIACFHNAPGCALSGLPTEEDSWFGGYRWQYAHCGECQEHLGWYYQNLSQRYFFGLIPDRLLRITQLPE